ncbi:DUF5000 domain-containing lipoprotein [Parapedobacter sp. 10938]|uniref:DUF5000 domain-containing lipoprotein n=1 Tax=Parapedobacter flavus TaxID=3110225 RepID=UPI002DBC13A4|nr:DUF5000 domain-containing lipoprotein [Parapedobacter sp. 10938]MEC3878496.1 DUF5000 domain-containing lipoprotein [Parapedobacter sp. 10938]
MKKINVYVWTVLVVGMMIGGQACKEEAQHTPINKNEDKPLSVLNPEVENLPGAAEITYNLPQSEGVLYVKAVYEIRPGVIQEAKASFYSNSIRVEGFGEAGEYDVSLYTVGRNEQYSDPLVVRVEPSTPHLVGVFESVEVVDSWGGAMVTLTNEAEANMTVEVLTTDELGDLIVAETFYTKMKNAKLPVRGYDPEERLFGVVVHDHWDNYSDTLFTEVVPWFEEEIPEGSFKKLNLPTDYTTAHNGGSATLEKIWDGNYGGSDYVSVPGHGIPQWFTFDMGVQARLSRVVTFNRTQSQYLYQSGSIKKWKIYGSNDPNPDGSFDDSWTLLLECESIKPSGLPTGSNTEEDKAYAAAGEEFTFPEDMEPVRYLRWQVTENWGKVTHVNIVEIDLFGQVQ